MRNHTHSLLGQLLETTPGPYATRGRPGEESVTLATPSPQGGSGFERNNGYVVHQAHPTSW